VASGELVGTWEYQGTKLTLNSKGRARMHAGDPPCLGSYSVEGNKMRIQYDPDTKGCVWGSPERIRVQGDALEVGPVTYKRVDARDDTSF
jgi:hypothetical protein